MAPAPNSVPVCRCAACGLGRLTPALLLIVVGGLLLAHMVVPDFTTLAAVGGFLVFAGALSLLSAVLPRPEPHPPGGSVFFPLLLLVVGVLILVRHALPHAPVGYWIANYWPLLLILWGVTRLFEHYARRQARSGLSGGEIAVVILVVVFGLTFSGIYRFGHSRMANYWGVDVDTWNPFLESYTFSAGVRADLSPAASTAVEIRGYRGNVTLVPGPAGSISATLQDTVRAATSEQASELFHRSQPLIRKEGGEWLVLPTGENSPRTIDADLKLTVPDSLPLTVAIEHGDVTVPKWGAGLDIRTTHGDITASQVRGDVRIVAGHDAVSLDQVTGSVTVTGGGGDVSISNVQGRVTLNGIFTGALSLRAIPAGLRFSSPRVDLTVAALPGSLDFDMGKISLVNANSISLYTRNQEIEIRNFSGPLQVHDRDSSISVTAAAPPSQPVTIINSNSDITVMVPPESRFHLDAEARNGEVQNPFPDAAAPLFSLHTSNGTIALRSSHP
ncbi:MAG TPA: hypothetical protein VN690_13455 [Terriglobales bacterium]|nr:hypothetical protein [Terriglobales bacterium]